MTDAPRQLDPERERMADPGHLEEGLDTASPWYLWGPYVAERAWGSVREDYSADGDAWSYFPHDHARSRAYRWNEDGMAGISDVFGRLCLGLALWNGNDPILKERMFGLANAEGNHGEDAKDYWWYLDALPSSAWLRWRYHYPQAAFPYEDLLEVNRQRSKLESEYELLDTGVFDAGYWAVNVDYAKSDPTDILMRITIKNAGPATATLHVLPTLWFRNTWSWGDGTARPSIIATDAGRSLFATHHELGDYALEVGPGPDGARPTLLFCENETNVERLFGQPATTPFPKDGINDHVVHGADTVAHGAGTKAAAWYQVTLEPGASAELRLRLRPTGEQPALDPLGPAFTEVIRSRQLEADAFYGGLARDGMTADEALIMRQAFAGMLWCKQFYAYNVSRWLAGDTEAPPPERRHGRNADWDHVDALDILSMPDSWEYPWFAAWDLAFHAITLSHVDPAFAKYQLLVLCREWFQHPDGALPAYEWSFDDVNPPVHAMAALQVFDIDGGRDLDFLRRIFHKLLLNFTWWLNREDSNGDDLFSGGFLGLDNLSAFDRSKLPFPGRLEQSDATAWMFAYCLSMLRMSAILTEQDASYRDLMITFMEHAVRIAGAINQQGLWDEGDAFYYDALHLPDGTRIPLRIHSMIGLLPVLPAASVPRRAAQLGAAFGKHFSRFLTDAGMTEETARARGSATSTRDGDRLLLSLLPPVELERVLGEVLDEDAFLSPHGLRALSRRHRDQPFSVTIGGVTATVDYEPGESTTGLFGGNSNWRGPVWFPVNYLVIESLLRWDDGLGETFTVDYPTGSGRRLRLRDVARDLAQRLVAIWLPDEGGRRPVYAPYERYATDPEWRGLLQFHEYFHGDTGAGIGASHQTGWTGLVAHLLCRGGVIERASRQASNGSSADEVDIAADALAAGRS